MIASRRAQSLAICATLFVVSFATMFAAQRDAGVARDEIDYMSAGEKYAAFWTDFLTFKDGTSSESNITSHFGGKAATANNREHPPLLKTMFGFSRRWFHTKLPLMSKLSAYRAPSSLITAILVVTIFLFCTPLWGRKVGIVAALLTLLLPRGFFHAGLATFDAAVAAMWMFTVFAYYKALGSRWWCLILGVVYGLALATKHNAIFLPVPLLVHYVLIGVLTVRREIEKSASFGERVKAVVLEILGRRPLIFVALGVIGPAVLVGLWPWLWFDTTSHLSDWISFHLKHVHYNFEYLGKNWNAPPFPFHVPIVTTLLTVPVVTLAAAVMGAFALSIDARRGKSVDVERAPALLLFLSAGAAMGPFILRTTPIFGAEKHFAAAMPTIAIFAAIGIAGAARLLARRLSWYVPLSSRFHERLPELSFAMIGLLAVGAAAVETFDAQPYALSHYNALAGGAPGGADLGMNRQFWGVSARGALPTINRLAAERLGTATGHGKRVQVYAHDADKTFGVYRSAGLLDGSVAVAQRENAGIRASKVAIVIHERHFNRHDYLIWNAYGTVKPTWVLRSDGVPIVSVYARELPRQPQQPQPPPTARPQSPPAATEDLTENPVKTGQ